MSTGVISQKFQNKRKLLVKHNKASWIKPFFHSIDIAWKKAGLN